MNKVGSPTEDLHLISSRPCWAYTKKSSRRQKASQILQKDAKFAPLFTAAYFGVMFKKE